MFFSDELRCAVGSYDAYDQICDSLPSNFLQADWLSQAQYLEMAIFLSNYLLSSQGDRMAMAHSVEIRLPYLDYRIIEFMARVPARWKILGLKEKHILRKCFRGVLPDIITERRNHPYRAPIDRSLLSYNTAERTAEILSDEGLRSAGLFDLQKVARLLKKLKTAQNLTEMDNMHWLAFSLRRSWSTSSCITLPNAMPAMLSPTWLSIAGTVNTSFG